MLRKVRIPLAIIFWLLITWLLVDFTGTAHLYLGWMARIQLMSALLSLNVGILVFLLALTLLWGRIYCSVICPLGVMQDAISWCRKKRFKYRFAPARPVLRWSMVLFAGAAFTFNLTWLASLVLPYSTYGSIASAVLAPAYKMGNNLLEMVAAHYQSYAVYGVEVWTKSVVALVIALVMWTIIAVLAWRGGRTWCNNICPVGTLLGVISRHAIFRPIINLDRCNGCGLCERECKASCIDSKNHAIDLSRCVMCGNCMKTCHRHALTLSTLPLVTPSAAVQGLESEKDTDRRNSRNSRRNPRGNSRGRGEEDKKKKNQPQQAAAPAPAPANADSEAGKRKRRRRKSNADNAEGQAQSQPQRQNQPQPEVKAQPQPEVKAQPQPEVKAQPQPEVKAQPQPEVKAQPQPEVKAQPQPEVKAQPQPEVKAQPQPEDPSRRAALTTTALLAGALVANAQRKARHGKTTDGGLTPITPKGQPKRAHLITPPGSLSMRNMQEHCTSCQLCINACPNDVLRPSEKLATLLMPEMSFEKGYCRPECNRCSQVCPTGAIKPIAVEERAAIQVGHAVWNRRLCIPAQEGKPCGNCARRCPNGAIQLVPASSKYQRGENGRWTDADGKQIDGRMVPMIPVVDTEKCTGCGACEHLCPVSPVSAITVEGNHLHRWI